MSLSTRFLISLLILISVATAWHGGLDAYARSSATDAFQRALAVAAIARAFNGVISVAQGTEVAVQPVGVGLTVTVGEILDPINDLVERFSFLALAASVALGVQISLGEISSSVFFSGLLSILGLLLLIQLWLPKASPPWLAFTLRAAAAVLFARFLIAVVLVTTHWLDQQFLAPQQSEALAALQRTTTAIENLNDEHTRLGETDLDASLFDRTRQQLGAWAEAASNPRRELEAIQARVENSVEEMIRLAVVFVLQTLLIPLGGAWLCWALLRAIWRREIGTKSG
ncbi:MAG: hypothetical protein AAF513_03995 [Pseudomonadota bacterium]